MQQSLLVYVYGASEEHFYKFIYIYIYFLRLALLTGELKTLLETGCSLYMGHLLYPLS